ncbi:MAG: DNA mismatch repair endonuclease MutL [Lachnospiraceae bacterium]|nr:DNA mismatch repair endonuclease MutL [Lachnospiraceae bacterium]
MVRNKIALLSQETIDQIAAGEVVERPSSVVKELVENAIDSGATAITVEIKDGGTSFIRVSDNGCGIPKDQIPLAFLRHSTSKIRDAKDLLSIHSLGFRGEALSSISAVSRMEMITKTEDELTGYHYVIEGSRETVFEEIGAPEGTTFLVHSLFFNTPARKKFLKSNTTEGNYIQDMMEHLAISHTEIAFSFIANGKEKLHTVGNGDLRDVVYQIYGKEMAQAVLPIEFSGDGFSCHGLIGEPRLNRGNRNYESFYVQGRYVKSSILSKAIETGYQGFVMQHQYPFCILFFEFDDAQVDVNVHPSKMEVRFDHQQDVFVSLERAVSYRLLNREDIQDVPIDEENSIEPEIESPKPAVTFEPFLTKQVEAAKIDFQENIRSKIMEEDTPITISSNTQKENFESEKPINSPQIVYEQQTFLSEESKPNFKIIGQVFDTYWIIEFQEKMYIIDQHAAHEKVLFERTMHSLSEHRMTSQMVSPPIVVSLSAVEQEAYERCRDAFLKLGFMIEPFGGKEYQITAVPGNLFSIDSKALFMDMINQCLDYKSSDTSELILERVASMSCKAAVKGNSKLTYSEVETLIEELLTLDNPYHCPHGRPTIIAMTKYELDKKFKRIV